MALRMVIRDTANSSANFFSPGRRLFSVKSAELSRILNRSAMLL
ncbi:hypothetical protein AKN40_0021 [Escherichia coli]|nr:hypothetical protein AKN40_0021 [Escherichia coli]EKI33744.1 hypothetical protein EC3006_4350 [Escherichia coli 3006]EMW32331.1 hypothetical protein EC2785200_3997 [Escherichia coli 2785200]EMW91998.1 hypothetical protein EC174750_4043 [Escherichia coli 174750]EMX36255.1 hypothetical protein ECMP0210171_4404 [Escherichia coli MP021017.1]ENA11218.1 hypothetical protein ECP02989421_4246 [Escherichia coli P0298942.1]ENB45074.1 hypothetical protein ECP029894211_4160 [Escherichia coli P0298942.